MRDLRHCATRNAFAFSFLAAIFLFPACGTRVSTLYEKVLGSPTYGRTTETYTRTKEVHDGLDTRFIFSATWLSHEWIRAFSEEYANIYYLDAERKEKVISLWEGESGTYVRFFVALFTPDEKRNDLEKKETLWSLRLGRGGGKGVWPAPPPQAR